MWHYCLKMEKEIRESTLAKVMLDLTRGQITKANKKHAGKFTPKYRAFNILQNKIEDVINKSTKIWKLIYGLTTVKDGEEDPLEEQHTKKGDKVEPNEREKIEEKIEEKGEEEKEDEEEETKKQDEIEIDEQEQQQDESVQDTQLLPPSPPHIIITPIVNVILKDVLDTSS